MPEKPTRAISIIQPWAWLITMEYKLVENRTWPTRTTGRTVRTGRGNGARPCCSMDRCRATPTPTIKKKFR